MSFEESAKKQAAGLGVGAAFGVVTGIASPGNARFNPQVPQTAIQVGEAAGAALRNGSSVSGAAAAGAAVLTAKATAVGAAAVAAAPVVAAAAVVGLVGYGLFKLFSDE